MKILGKGELGVQDLEVNVWESGLGDLEDVVDLVLFGFLGHFFVLLLKLIIKSLQYQNTNY